MHKRRSPTRPRGSNVTAAPPGALVIPVGDRLPFLIPHIATERMELHLRDLRRYIQNRGEAAEHARQILKAVLRQAYAARRPILLIAHSMGSVIAYDSLWQMSRAHREPMQIDLLLTMGSPLGQDYIRKRLKGNDAIGAVRYPNNIRDWINLSAVGDLTAMDPTLKRNFQGMLAPPWLMASTIAKSTTGFARRRPQSALRVWLPGKSGDRHNRSRLVARRQP